VEIKEIENALKEALKKAGTQLALAEKAGMSQGNLNGLLNGKNKIENMTVGTLLKLFPDLQMRFFRGAEFSNIKVDPIEEQVLEITRTLTAKEKAKCLTIIAANFNSSIQYKKQ
jgi:transcriptional regulator with XRE-family HTH domain